MVHKPSISTPLACIETMSAQELSFEDEQQVTPRTTAEDSEQLPQNGEENSTETMTMEERKSKMEQLRARMVRAYTRCAHHSIHCFFRSGHLREQIDNHLSRSLQGPKSQLGMPHGLSDRRNWQRCCGLKQRLRRTGRTSNVQRIGTGR